MSEWEDQKDKKSRILFINRCRNAVDLVKYVDKIFPDWIEDIADHFNSDLKPLIDNWDLVCKKAKVKKRQVILVKKVIFHGEKDSDKYTVMVAALDNLTKQGYCVREHKNFTVCLTKKCKGVMICKAMKNSLFKNKQTVRPFTNLCIDCIRKNVKQSA